VQNSVLRAGDALNSNLTGSRLKQRQQFGCSVSQIFVGLAQGLT
jgi:hypothetical protein